MTAQETRNRILDAALRLFNEHGTASISTNHVATEAGISPGNLYYHYRNKEEIIREMLERMYSAWEGAWFEQSDRGPDIDDLRTLIRMNFQLLWEFRFFYRESTALMLRDPLLKQRHAEMQASRLDQQARFYEGFIESGVMRAPTDGQAIPDLVRISWILATNWLGFLEEGGIEPTAERMRDGERMILRVFRPYLSEDKGTDLINEYEP
ncbi:MAG: TetR/AcrR family transcriptional regulator [Sphaerobacteraceae bacterium]|nr:MAG: TetR/AcrR family transcriptional regulator [Sphaerobacteraceae bacterium]